jgi:NifU-like protein involved in Fe-S cluster formation
VRVEDGLITGYGHEVQACALGQDVRGDRRHHVVGTPGCRVPTPSATRMTAMLKAGAPAPSGERWVDLKYLEPVRDYRPRHASTLLVFDALCDALDKLEATAA